MLAAVTCLFNPSNSVRRLANYHQVADDLAELGIDLWTVEAIYPGQQFAIPAAPRVLRYQCEADQVLWQKERLLNLAIHELPAVDGILWVDADVLFDCQEIAAAIEQALERYPIVQPWQYAVLLGPGGGRDIWPSGHHVAESIASHNFACVQSGELGDVNPRAAHTGYAWAMRRETWQQLGGLYELDLSGVGDATMAAFWYGALDAEGDRRNPYLRYATPAAADHAIAWGQRAWEVVQGQIGYLPLAIGHLYHGPMTARRYGQRARRIAGYGYDPPRDVIRNPGEALRWSSSAPQDLVDWCERWLTRLQREDA